MKKKALIIGCVLLAVSIFMGVAVIIKSNKTDGNRMTDEEIKAKFSCNRVTADVRPTDVYCANSDLYRQHLKENKVIKYPL